MKLDNAYVVKWGGLKDTIRKLSKQKVIDTTRVEQIVSLLQSSNIDSAETRKEHVEEIHRKKESIASGVCPRCGGKLVVRNGKRGKFMGCSNYPKCRYTCEIGNNT